MSRGIGLSVSRICKPSFSNLKVVHVFIFKIKIQVSCTRPQMVETCLFIVCHMMSHATKSPSMTSKTQNAMLQLGVVACNQLKVLF